MATPPLFGIIGINTDGSRVDVEFFASNKTDARRIFTSDYPQAKITVINRIN